MQDLPVLLFNFKSKKVWRVTKKSGADRVHGPVKGERQRKRAKSLANKEHKRLKRLLRNRVSAQQARERKKAHLHGSETRARELESKNSELEEKISTLQNENQMLRHVCHLPHTVVVVIMRLLKTLCQWVILMGFMLLSHMMSYTVSHARQFHNSSLTLFLDKTKNYAYNQ